MPLAETLSQGDEVVTGQVVDTNAAWLASRFVELGFEVGRHTVVGDRLADIVAVAKEIAGRGALCVCTGGLGPTSDDLTAEAIAVAFDRPLLFDPEAMAQIEARYASAGRVMAETNRKQAWFPAGAERIDNAWGTAPGFAVAEKGTRFVFLPGVPREMKSMFDSLVAPDLLSRFRLQPGRLVTLRVVGLGESDIQQRLAGLVWPDGIVFGTRTQLPENHVKLRCTPTVTADVIGALVAEVRRRVGAHVFAVEGLPGTPEVDTQGGPLVEVVSRLLAARGQTVAVAESCTGGRLAAAFTSVPGASGWFSEGIVSYANAAKSRLLEVAPSLLAEHGAVSEPVARAMAEGCRKGAQTTWALAVTGVAGPGGGTETKPVGTVFIALAGPVGTLCRSFRLPGDRDRVQSLTVATALDLLRRTLLTNSFPNVPPVEPA